MLISETRRLRFQYRSIPRLIFSFYRWLSLTPLGFFCSISFMGWFIYKTNMNQTSMRTFFNEKLLKYIPIEHGGNFLFPFSMYNLQTFKNFPKTQWSSFDKKSFFPHTDKFKVKVAIAHEDFSLLNTILDRKFDINSFVDSEKKLTPVALASLLGKTEMVEFLHSRGADIECVDFEGNTPAMLAVVYDQPRTLQRLISLGADLQKKDVYGFTALDKAENRANVGIVEFLKEVKQQEKVPIVKPFTYTLESYDFMLENRAKGVVEKYDIKRYFKPQAYPYFKSTKGFLCYLFPAVDVEDLEMHVSPSVYFNPRDDKMTSDQDMFSFGDFLSERMARGGV